MRGLQLTAFEKYVIKAGYHNMFDYTGTLWLVDWKAYGLPHCSLYVVSTDSKWPCKIGISINPYNRIKGIQTGVWRQVDVHKCYYLKSVKEAKELEKKIHQTLTEDGRWLHGEWFDLRPEQTSEVIEFNATVLGLEIFDEIQEEEIKQDMADCVRRAKAKIHYNATERNLNAQFGY